MKNSERVKDLEETADFSDFLRVLTMLATAQGLALAVLFAEITKNSRVLKYLVKIPNT